MKRLNFKLFNSKLGLFISGAIISCIIFLINIAGAQPGGWIKYNDPVGQFAFRYPSDYGKISRGTKSGFGNRVAAFRFSNFSFGNHHRKFVLGGEAVLTKGRVTLDIQAAGGLYDAISMEILSEPIKKKLIKNLPPLNVTNFCKLIAIEDHIDLRKKGLRRLSSKMKNGIRQIDRMRNLKPKLIFCDRSGSTISFYKTATFQIGANRSRQHIYGAVRFLRPPYSSFQIIRGANGPPNKKTVASMRDLVNSIKIHK